MYKVAKLKSLVADQMDGGYKVIFFAVEVSARGLVCKSAYEATEGLKETKRSRSMRSLGDDAEKESLWLWLSHSERENKLLQ